jgi:hypothetical protein
MCPLGRVLAHSCNTPKEWGVATSMESPARNSSSLRKKSPVREKSGLPAGAPGKRRQQSHTRAQRHDFLSAVARLGTVAAAAAADLCWRVAGGRSQHPRYEGPSSCLYQRSAAAKPAPVTTPPGSFATGGRNHAGTDRPTHPYPATGTGYEKGKAAVEQLTGAYAYLLKIAGC